VNELLRLGHGDAYRLQDIQHRLENGKVLYGSDNDYLQKLVYRYRGEIQKIMVHKKPKPIHEPIPEPIHEPIPEPIHEPIHEPIPEPEPIHEPIPEPIMMNQSEVLQSKKEFNENTLSKSEINEKQENPTFCTNCGKQFLDSSKFCTNCGKSSDDISEDPITQSVQPAGKIWYLLPLTLYWIGGIIAWAKIKNRNPTRARNCLIVGFLCSILPLIPAGIFLLGAIGMGSGSSEINDALSVFPEQIQNIKREQILTCENNMGYLQSIELGEMIKERCINSILGK